jgi:hypothetical protein
MNDGLLKLHTGYLVEGLELFISKVAYTTNDATSLVRWSNCTRFSMRVRLEMDCRVFFISVGRQLFCVGSQHMCFIGAA